MGQDGEKVSELIVPGKGRLRVRSESSGLDTVVNGRLRSVEDVAEILGVEVRDGKIEAVVDGVKIRMERGKLELEYEDGERVTIERA